jgi:hypothetical protein
MIASSNYDVNIAIMLLLCYIITMNSCDHIDDFEVYHLTNPYLELRHGMTKTNVKTSIIDDGVHNANSKHSQCYRDCLGNDLDMSDTLKHTCRQACDLGNTPRYKDSPNQGIKDIEKLANFNGVQISQNDAIQQIRDLGCHRIEGYENTHWENNYCK